MKNIILQNRSIIEIAGEDRTKFLQGLITNDINKINNSNLVHALMLNAQGRFLYDFFLFEKDNKILLDCLNSRVDEIIQKLKFYKLRAKVEIAKNENLKVLWNLHPQDGLSFKDPRHQEMGYRLYQENPQNYLEDESFYHYQRITNKICEGEYDLTYEKSFILEFGFDNLNAVDYNKGCYIGQEPTARIHHLGQIRKELIYLKLKEELAKNTEITCEDQSSALVLSSIFYNNEIHALALKRSV